MFLVTAVVVGHAWGLLISTGYARWLYDFLFFWHIPAFVLVSGYLSRSFRWDRRHLRSLVTTLLVPYLLFEPALYYFRHWLGQVNTGHLWIVPHWTMWYLPALIMWRLATPLLRVNAAVVFPLSVLVSLVGGLWSGQILCLARVMGLLPFFVLGLYLTPASLRTLDRRWVRGLAALAMVGILVAAHSTDEWARTAFLYYDAGYQDLGWHPLPAMQVRAIVIGLGMVGSLSVLALIPRRGGWFAAMGSATMIVYLFHGFPIRYADYLGWPEWAAAHPQVGTLLTTLAAVGLALLLASAPVRRRLVWAVDPIGSWERRRAALRRKADEGPGPATSGPPSATPAPPDPGPRR